MGLDTIDNRSVLLSEVFSAMTPGQRINVRIYDNTTLNMGDEKIDLPHGAEFYLSCNEDGKAILSTLGISITLSDDTLSQIIIDNEQ